MSAVSAYPQAPAMRLLSMTDIRRPVRTVMPNGVPLYVLEQADADVVRLDLLMAGGRWQQDQPLQALFTNRMLREGTACYSSSRIAEVLDFYGAWLDLSNSSEHTCVTLHSLAKYLPQTLDVLSSMIKEPLFPEKELETVLSANVQQFNVRLSQVGFLAHRAMAGLVFGSSHPCGRPVSAEDYGRITSEALRRFHRRHYHSGNLTLLLSGKVTDDVVRLVERHFGAEAFGCTESVLERKRFSVSPSEEKRVFVERADALQSAVRMGCATLPCQHPDFGGLRVLFTLFGGYFGSRLMSNIREDKGYTYGIYANVASYPECSLLMVSAETTNELVAPLVSEVGVEIDKLQNDLVSARELDMVRNYMLGDMCRGCESVLSLAEMWVSALLLGLSSDSYARTLQAIQTVTPEEVRELARKYLCKENLKEAVSGKKVL